MDNQMNQTPYDDYGQPDPPFQPYDRVPPPPRRSWLERRLEDPAFQFFLRRNKHTLIAMTVALVIAVVILTAGFFETLLILILMGIGFLVGGFLDGNPRVYHWIDRFRR